MNAAPQIGNLQLAAGLVFILLAGLAARAFRLGLSRDLAVGTLRTFGQLFAMGYVLAVVFARRSPLLTFALYLVMLVAAVRVVTGRSGPRAGGVRIALPVGLSMLLAYSVTSLLVTKVIIGVEPWWEPQTFLPIAGMVIGNSMTALALALERLFSELHTKRAVVEMLLAHGATPQEASLDAVRQAVRAGMAPSITALMGVGLVFLPGMMTGQILAGADPQAAIRYQIVVMLMLVGSTTITSVLAVLWVRRRCFTARQQLRV